MCTCSRQRRQRMTWGPRSSCAGSVHQSLQLHRLPVTLIRRERPSELLTPRPSRTALHPALGMEQGSGRPAEGSAAGPSAAEGQGGLVSSNVYFRVACTVALLRSPE